MALKYKSSDSGNLDVSKPRRKVLHLTEKVKVLNKGEKKKSYTEVAKIHIKNKSSVVKLWRRKKKSMLALLLHLSSKSYSPKAWSSIYLRWKRHETCTIRYFEKSKLQWFTTSHWTECPSLESLQITNAREGVDRREPSCIVGGNASGCSHGGKQYGDSSENKQTKKTRMITWSSNSTPVHLCRQNYHSKGYMPPAFTAALFTRAKTCPLADEWIKNMWYIYTMEHSSAIKITTSSAVTCTQLEIIILSTSGRKKQTTHDITYMWHLNLWFHEPTCETDWRSYYRAQGPTIEHRELQLTSYDKPYWKRIFKKRWFERQTHIHTTFIQCIVIIVLFCYYYI